MAEGPQFSVVPGSVYLDPDLSDQAKLVAGVVGRYMNRHGSCRPGIERLAQDRGVEERTIRRALTELVERGHLVVTRKARSNAVLTWVAPMSGHMFVRSPTKMTGHEVPHERANIPLVTGYMGSDQLTTTFGSENGRTANGKSIRSRTQPTALGPEVSRLPGESTADWIARVGSQSPS